MMYCFVLLDMVSVAVLQLLTLAFVCGGAFARCRCSGQLHSCRQCTRIRGCTSVSELFYLSHMRSSAATATGSGGGGLHSCRCVPGLQVFCLVLARMWKGCTMAVRWLVVAMEKMSFVLLALLAVVLEQTWKSLARLSSCTPLEIASCLCVVNDDVFQNNGYQKVVSLLVLMLAAMEWHVSPVFKHHEVLCSLLTAFVMHGLCFPADAAVVTALHYECVLMSFLFPTFGRSSAACTSHERTVVLPSNEGLELSLHNQSCYRLPTRGDGKCAIHSAFGEVTQFSSELQHLNAHALIKSSLGMSLAMLKTKVKQEDFHLVDEVASKMWSDIVQPHWKNPDQWPLLANEKRSFLDHLHRRIGDTTALCIQEALSTQVNIKRLIQRCQDHSIQAFPRSLEAILWRTLAVQQGLLPSNTVDFLACSANEIASYSDVASPFLAPPWIFRGGRVFAAGSNDEYPGDMDARPFSKYEALFDDRPAFNALRYSFLHTVCPADCSDLQTLVAYVDMADNDLSNILEFIIDDLAPIHEAQQRGGCPVNFCNEVWPIYVERMCDPDLQFYLSYEELLLICI